MQTSRCNDMFFLRLLGFFQLRRGDQVLPVTPSCQRLLALVSLRELTRRGAARTLWPDVEERCARASLRTTIWQVRKLDHRLIETCGEELRPGPLVYVDASDLVSRIRNSEEVHSPDFLGILLRGDLLLDWDEQWVHEEREVICNLRQHALENCGWFLLLRGRRREAYEIGLAAARARPMGEGPHRLLVQACLEDGDLSGALAVFFRYRDRLAKKGMDPGQNMLRLIEPVVGGEFEHISAVSDYDN